jgi:hypothetical protein
LFHNLQLSHTLMKWSKNLVWLSPIFAPTPKNENQQEKNGHFGLHGEEACSSTGDLFVDTLLMRFWKNKELDDKQSLVAVTHSMVWRDHIQKICLIIDFWVQTQHFRSLFICPMNGVSTGSNDT